MKTKDLNERLAFVRETNTLLLARNVYLEAKLARIAAIIEQHIDEQTAFDRICEEMECKT